MRQSIDYFIGRSDDWLIGGDRQQLIQLTGQLYVELSQFEIAPRIILAESEPVKFLAGFLAACAAGCPVFLSNPNWVEQEWQQVFEIVQPDVILGDGDWELLSKNYSNPRTNDSNWVMVPTGGSSGKIRFAIHTWETLTASAIGFQRYFHLQQINSFCTLPLYHVSGLMQFMRSFTTGGKLAIQQFKQIENNEFSNICPHEFFISLVPTQLQRLLQNSTSAAWLSQFKTVLLGGAPAWQELLRNARQKNIKLALTYGMTETASGIAILKPQDFLEGKNNCGQTLPHTTITICGDTGKQLSQNEIGNITISSHSLALGYYPKLFKNQENFKLDDLGFIDDQGYLNIVGRNSNKIITGGENVYPEEVEAAIRATNLVKDVCVIGISDRIWGQSVIAIYVKKDSRVSPNRLQALITKKLSKYKQPKHWIAIEHIPRNYQGKINYKHINVLAIEHLKILHNSS